MYFIAENLREKFDNISIDVSFECEKGTMTSIVGASGSGKSTVLRLICGLDKPEPAQKIILDGIDITGEKPAKRKLNGFSKSFFIQSPVLMIMLHMG